MSHTRVKTTYSVEGAYGSTETKTLYCDHDHSIDCVTFYDEDGSVTQMCFSEWKDGNDLWDAMERLWVPFKNEWNGELKENVEYYHNAPWEEESKKAKGKSKKRQEVVGREEKKKVKRK